MSVRRILDAFDRWRRQGEPVALATVYQTLGSTYSKAGHRMLIAGNGDYQGLISGGCLEGDLAERARTVLRHGEAATVTYDLRDEADELWGLGIGCNGLIRVLLQPLSRTDDYQPFTAIADRLRDHRPAVVAMVIADAGGRLQPGATLICSDGGVRPWGVDTALIPELVSGCELVGTDGDARCATLPGGITVLYAPLRPLPRLLVLGAGPDAVPVVTVARELGWRVTVVDHRPAYLSLQRFIDADATVVVDPDNLPASVALDDFDAAVVMSHHLQTDRLYLRQLATLPLRYLGVLGPPARRARLIEDLGEVGHHLRTGLRGPVGLDIGAETPEAIAVALLAEIHAVLYGRDAAPLSGR